MDPGGLGWLEGFDELFVRCGLDSNGPPLFDAQGRPLLLFEDSWALRWALEREKEIVFHESAP